MSGLEEYSLRRLVDLLQSGLLPDQFTIATVLRLCSSPEESYCLDRQVHTCASKFGIILN
jgi:hypothetical protein